MLVLARSKFMPRRAQLTSRRSRSFVFCGNSLLSRSRAPLSRKILFALAASSVRKEILLRNVKILC
jgi:hypothetical protein